MSEIGRISLAAPTFHEKSIQATDQIHQSLTGQHVADRQASWSAVYRRTKVQHRVDACYAD